MTTSPRPRTGHRPPAAAVPVAVSVLIAQGLRRTTGTDRAASPVIAHTTPSTGPGGYPGRYATASGPDNTLTDRTPTSDLSSGTGFDSSWDVTLTIGGQRSAVRAASCVREPDPDRTVTTGSTASRGTDPADRPLNPATRSVPDGDPPPPSGRNAGTHASATPHRSRPPTPGSVPHRRNHHGDRPVRGSVPPPRARPRGTGHPYRSGGPRPRPHQGGRRPIHHGRDPRS